MGNMESYFVTLDKILKIHEGNNELIQMRGLLEADDRLLGLSRKEAPSFSPFHKVKIAIREVRFEISWFVDKDMVGRKLCSLGFHHLSKWKFGGGGATKHCLRWGCKKKIEGITQDIVDSWR